MDRRLLKPKWLVAHLVVAIVAVVFVNLGFWQLDRLEERRTLNATIAQRFSMEPVPFETLENEDPETIEYRRVTVAGRVISTGEVLIRSQVYLGASGYHLILPIAHRGASEVLINRGWVPLGTEIGTTDHGVPEGRFLEVEGWIHLTQERSALGPEDPAEGVLTVMSRVNIARIQEQTNPRVDVADVYLVEIGEQGSDPPIPVKPPTFGEEGPHLGYAIQWFAFSLIAAVGYGFLARRQLRDSA